MPIAAGKGTANSETWGLIDALSSVEPLQRLQLLGHPVRGGRRIEHRRDEPPGALV
jgi:hypothetical protein